MLEMLWKLFISFFQVGLFSFGGGYASLPLIREQVVDINKWLRMDEFADLVTISQMTPGPVGINAATFTGTRMAGVAGAIVATVGNVAAPCIILAIIGGIYFRYTKTQLIGDIMSTLRPAVTAMMWAAALDLIIIALLPNFLSFASLGSFDFVALGLFLGSLALLIFTKMRPIAVMLLSGVVGGAIYWFTGTP